MLLLQVSSDTSRFRVEEMSFFVRASCLTEEDAGVLRCERGFELWMSRVIMLPIIVRLEPQAQVFFGALFCVISGHIIIYIYI